MSVHAEIAVAATRQDYADVRPLVQKHIAFERSDVAIPDDWERVIASRAHDGAVVIFVARIDGDVAGYASMTSDVTTWTGEPFGHLDCVYVAEARRSAGLGRLLVAATAESARARGYRELQWQTPAWNEAAVRFYERLGATHRPKQRFSLAL
ncbi:GNAT family N-acetyltransferase [Agromyces italicus]|uniref:GNAT family N-acetyltransferase n=1 Tax=Agromyces italicus TaxID=279572 RepID=UPI0003B70CE0|nr:GNAT family N-acetyltransferase [Agromyces italicus]